MENRKITDYLVLTADSRNKIVGLVNEHIKIGFEPVGAVVITEDVKESRMPRIKLDFYQTLVRYSMEEEG